MKVAELLDSRRDNWQQLENLCLEMEQRRAGKLAADRVMQFASLYRSACADLALADAYQLPPSTIRYLHRLVGRAHNQLYRSRAFDFASWGRVLLLQIPSRIFNDRCVQVAFCLFWGAFVLSAALAAFPSLWPDYAEQLLTAETIQHLEDMYSQSSNGSDPGVRSVLDPGVHSIMASYYIRHNTGIGLQCFAYGLFIVPGLAVTVFNALFLGAAFGYMARPEVPGGTNFFDFVTAHGPLELTAIVLSAGAGLRLGLSWIRTAGLGRVSSLRKTAVESMPLMGAAMILFFLAALVEGFVSPSAAPYWIKASVAIVTSALLMVYFVVLGYPRR